MPSILSIAVRVRDETARGLRSVHGSLRRAEGRIRDMWRDAGRSAASAFTAALNGGIGSAIRELASNPITAGIAVAIVAALASSIGAALAGAIVFAIGGAVAGLGIALAAQSKEVKKKWAATLAELKPLFMDAAKPMLPVIEEARRRFLQLGKDLAPNFESALSRMQGAVTKFVEHTDIGFRKMLRGAGPDMVSSFNTLMQAFGPAWEDFLMEAGRSLGALARTVREHSVEITAAMRAVLGIFNILIDTINFLANAWAMFIEGFFRGTAYAMKGLQFLAEAAFDAFALILTAADIGLSWIPDWGNEIGKARDEFDRFRDGAVRSIGITSDRIMGMADTIAETNKRNKLNADISALEGKVATAKAKLQTVSDKKTQAKIRAEIGQLNAAIAAAKAKLASVDGMTATMRIITQSVTYRSVHDIVGKATGGIIGAATGGVRSNMTLVGEHGPELVNLPAGSRVRSNSDTRRMMGSGVSSATEPFQINISLGDHQIADLLVDPIRRVVSRRGGVQATFGKL